MGLIGDAFSKLFGFLGNLFKGLFGVIWDVIKWVGRLLKSLFQGLIDLLVGFFKVIYALIDGLLYLLYMIGVLAVKLFLVIFEAAKIIWSLIVGFTKTLASLTYSPRASGGHGYSEIMGKLFDNLSFLQIDVVAYVLLFILWFVTAIAAIKLISSMKGA